MFGKKPQPPIKSLIAPGTKVEGHITFSEGLRVDGEVVGDIIAASDGPSILLISESAMVQGELRADHVIVNGRVRGPVHSRELLELQPKAQIEGDVAYKSLEMHQGAVISGQMRPLGVTTVEAAVEEKPLLKLASKVG